jgi:hypothetical protein
MLFATWVNSWWVPSGKQQPHVVLLSRFCLLLLFRFFCSVAHVVWDNAMVLLSPYTLYIFPADLGLHHAVTPPQQQLQQPHGTVSAVLFLSLVPQGAIR